MVGVAECGNGHNADSKLQNGTSYISWGKDGKVVYFKCDKLVIPPCRQVPQVPEKIYNLIKDVCMLYY